MAEPRMINAAEVGRASLPSKALQSRRQYLEIERLILLLSTKTCAKNVT